MHWSKSIRKVFRLWQSVKAHPSSQPHSNFRLPGRVMISRYCMLSLRGVLRQNWLKHALQHFTIRMLNCHLAAQPQIWTKTHASICLSSSTQVTIGQLLTASAILEQVWDAFHLSKLQHIQGHNKTSTTWNHSVLVELLRCYWKSECPKVSVVLLATGLCSTQLAELQSIYTKECCTRKSPNWNSAKTQESICLSSSLSDNFLLLLPTTLDVWTNLECLLVGKEFHLQAATYSGAQQDQHNVESLSSSGICYAAAGGQNVLPKLVVLLTTGHALNVSILWNLWAFGTNFD